MTFCLGIKVREGLVGLSDTLISAGSESIRAHKVATYQQNGQTFFLLTSGLRSVRDKALIYFEELLEAQAEPFDKLYKAVNALATCVRRVEAEDQAALRSAGMYIDLHCLVGGQLSHDSEHKLFLMYPQGNWVEIGPGTPYQIVGLGGYGKPILDRTLRYEDSMGYALKVACLAFDSTRNSASDVGFPVDVVLYRKDTFRVVQHTFDKEAIQPLCDWWGNRLRASMHELPAMPLDALMAEVLSPDSSSPP
jgi:putative proteasome-type protease